MRRALALVVVVQLLSIWVVTAGAQQARPNKTVGVVIATVGSPASTFGDGAISEQTAARCAQPDLEIHYPMVWFGSSRV